MTSGQETERVYSYNPEPAWEGKKPHSPHGASIYVHWAFISIDYCIPKAFQRWTIEACWCEIFAGWIPFLSPSQHHQRTEVVKLVKYTIKNLSKSGNSLQHLVENQDGRRAGVQLQQPENLRVESRLMPNSRRVNDHKNYTHHNELTYLLTVNTRWVQGEKSTSTPYHDSSMSTCVQNLVAIVNNTVLIAIILESAISFRLNYNTVWKLFIVRYSRDILILMQQSWNTLPYWHRRFPGFLHSVILRYHSERSSSRFKPEIPSSTC